MITFAGALRPQVELAKQAWIEGGQIVRVEPAPNAWWYGFRQVEVGDLDGLVAALEFAAEHGQIAVRGEPKAKYGRRAIHDDSKKGPAGLTIVPRTWAAFDWDGVPISAWQPEAAADDPAESWNWSRPDPLLDPEIGARECLRRLPPAFRGVSCAWQVTGSAGFKPGWRLRTWHLLDHPCTGEELKVWLKPAIDRKMVDPVTLVEAQPHYLAVKAVGGADPCPRRFGILEQAERLVRVPDIAGIKRQQQARKPAAAPAAPVEERLQACIDAVRSAPDGTKHPTYYTEAARAKALCDRFGVDWAPWRDALMRTYEASLAPQEAARRRKGSTEGVIRWVESR